MKTIPLIELDPPNVLPLGISIILPSVPQLGSALKSQFTFGLISVFIKPAGICMKGFQSGGPASKMHTEFFSLALSLLAKTQPEEPAPTMM